MDYKAFYILASHQRNMLAESLAIYLNETVPMPILLCGHAVEEVSRGREVRAQRFSEVAIDARVFFLSGDGEGKYLRFVQVLETHGSNCCHDTIGGNNSKNREIRPGKSRQKHNGECRIKSPTVKFRAHTSAAKTARYLGLFPKIHKICFGNSEKIRQINGKRTIGYDSGASCDCGLPTVSLF